MFSSLKRSSSTPVGMISIGVLTPYEVSISIVFLDGVISFTQLSQYSLDQDTTSFFKPLSSVLELMKLT